MSGFTRRGGLSCNKELYKQKLTELDKNIPTLSLVSLRQNICLEISVPSELWGCKCCSCMEMCVSRKTTQSGSTNSSPANMDRALYSVGTNNWFSFASAGIQC